MSDTTLVTSCGDVIDLAVDRWRGYPDAIEMSLLASLPDPVLDVGCGPGRIVAALAATGRIALGIDPSGAAVDEAHQRRAPVLRRSVFGPLPGERRWGAVLLLDGSVGIGGDPVVLLRRGFDLLRSGGQIVAEVEGPGSDTHSVTARIESADVTSPWFPWAQVGVDDFARLVAEAGLHAAGLSVGAGRWFARAVKP
jgi:SAM-dependent methyltransferase